MAISLVDNLMAINVVQATNNAAMQRTSSVQDAIQTEITDQAGTTDNNDVISQNNTAQESSEDFGETLAKKIESKDSESVEKNNNQEEAENDQEETKEADDSTSLEQLLLAGVPATQNISVDTKVENAPPVETQIKPERIVTEATKPQTPVISATVETINIQESAANLEHPTEQTTTQQTNIENIQTLNNDSNAQPENVTNEVIVSKPQENEQIVNNSSNENEIVSDIDNNAESKPAETASNDLETKQPKEVVHKIEKQDKTTTNEQLPEVKNNSNTVDQQNDTINPAFKTNIQNSNDIQGQPQNAAAKITETAPIKAEVLQKDTQSKAEPTTKNINHNKIQTNVTNDTEIKSGGIKVNPEIQTSANQIPTNSKKSINIDEQLTNNSLSQNNIQDLSSSHLPKQEIGVANSNEIQKDSTVNVTSQIRESIQTSLNSDNKQIVIQLDPPELGKVSVNITENSSGITGLLSVDNAQTKHQIQQNLPEIIQNLQDSGVNVKKIEVVLAGNNQEQQTMKEQSSMSGQNNWYGQQQSQSNPESHRYNTVYNQWTSSNDSISQFEEQEMQFTGSSVNMLA